MMLTTNNPSNGKQLSPRKVMPIPNVIRICFFFPIISTHITNSNLIFIHYQSVYYSHQSPPNKQRPQFNDVERSAMKKIGEAGAQHSALKKVSAADVNAIAARVRFYSLFLRVFSSENKGFSMF